MMSETVLPFEEALFPFLSKDRQSLSQLRIACFFLNNLVILLRIF